MDKSEKTISSVGIVCLAIIAGLVLISLITFVPKTEVDNLQRFESYDALTASFNEAKNNDYYPRYFDMGLNVMPTAMGAVKESMAADSSGGSDFSTTNIQVQGVDEADIMKTDGKYAYLVSNNVIYIVNAYPAENAEIISTIELDGDINPTEIFINGDKLAVFARSYGGDCFGCLMEAENSRGFGDSGSAIVLNIDISDKTSPVIEKRFEFEGQYLTSRMIGNKVYFVINSYPTYWLEDTNNIIPFMREDGVSTQIAEATEVGFIPEVPSTSFVTIAGLDIHTNELEKETIAASGQAVYASAQNLYLAERVWNRDVLPMPFEILKSVFIPSWGEVEKTSVIKFSLDEGKPSFVAEGTVPGYVLNQFSMDEHEGNFRIATTVGRVSRGGDESSNNIYVLGEDMNVVGLLEDLAPGEKIYSARFMGNKGYVVTFKKVDPLFVINLSDPTNPNVLGKLKIPGYSDYLHPIDETHLIGIGKDTIESSYGDFAWYQGIKMAIFDVSDVSNPIELHKIIIGDRGTDSYALNDHRAFLFDKEKELLVLPVTLHEIPEEQKVPIEDDDPGVESTIMPMDFPSYGEAVFQGAMVFDVSIANGFSERGRITHVSEEDELKRGYYYGSNYSVQRSFFIDEALYTFSPSALKANNLTTLEEIRTVLLE
jgi:inhibitor of cysteine peptidase